MKKILLLFISFLTTPLVIGQSIQEICEMSNTNGTVVDYQYFNGTLYSTGFFKVICDKPVGYMAKWENNEWQPTSISITDPGHSLSVINDKLYIAKYEESIDSNWVYVYDNSSLEKVGQGVYLTTASGFSELPNIYDIIEYDGKIVACGEFDRVGQASIKGIMQWDGINWESMGLGLNGNIPGTPPVMYPHQMMVHNSELYVVGNFKDAGGEQVNGIAKWNGLEWSNMGVGFNSTVYGIAVLNDDIIVGGSFTKSGGTSVNRIAKWDGANWVPLDFGFTETSMNDFIFVHTLKVLDDVLYIGGGLKEITYSDNTTEVCNGIVGYFENSLNTFNGGVIGNDIEAIEKIENEQLLIGGGVFGTGYTGITTINTNIKEKDFTAEVKISPNPFEESINIFTKNTFEKYEILDGIGKIVKNGKYDNSIQLALPPGVYFLRLISKGKSYSMHKIIKM